MPGKRGEELGHNLKVTEGRKSLGFRYCHLFPKSLRLWMKICRKVIKNVSRYEKLNTEIVIMIK